jgi:hypothetical protein
LLANSGDGRTLIRMLRVIELARGVRVRVRVRVRVMEPRSAGSAMALPARGMDSHGWSPYTLRSSVLCD